MEAKACSHAYDCKVILRIYTCTFSLQSYAREQAFASMFYTSFAAFSQNVFVGQALNVKRAIISYNRQIGRPVLKPAARPTLKQTNIALAS